MGGSTLPVGMVWNYIGGIGIELDRCSQKSENSNYWRFFFNAMVKSSVKSLMKIEKLTDKGKKKKKGTSK